MFFSLHNIKFQTVHKGFTLIELLVVLTLLGIVAGLAMTNYGGVQDQARYDVVKFEMTEIRKALLQFRKDSGTNSFPAQGSYDCTDFINGGSGTDVNSEFAFPVEAGSTNAQIIAWCQHPSNFWMLFTNPFDTATFPEKEWNLDTKRGWNGPYLQRKDGFLSLDSNTINLDDIDQLTWAIADPHVVNHQNTETGVQWSVQTSSTILDTAGSPYLMLVDIVNATPVYEPRIISAGEDGIFELNNIDECIVPVDGDGQALDQVLCLLN